MKKLALLIGNTNNLKGVRKDIYDFKTYLKSGIGGAWTEEEIKCAFNISLLDLNTYLTNVRKYDWDYLIFYFSGHGGMDNKGVTHLEINSREETISECSIVNIAKRQLNIFDCCRVNVLEPSMLHGIDVRMFSDYSTNLKIYRQIFEKKILAIPPQNVTLYACDKGQKSIDTVSGGVYTQALLESAYEISDKKDVKIEDAHSLAYNKIQVHNYKQTPSGNITIGINYNQQLIFALKQPLIGF